MAISKIILNGTTQMDTTQVTVDSSNLLSGYTALGRDGETLTGTTTFPVQSVNNKTGAVVLNASDVGAEPEALVVHVTQSGNTYSADATYNQIMEAVAADKRVIAVLNGVEYQLTRAIAQEYQVTFASVREGIAYFIYVVWGSGVYVSTTPIGTYSKPSGGIPASDLVTGISVPSGGNLGQVLKKASNTDYNTEWADESSGGTSDYSDLTNKPQINSVTLSGNKSLADLGITPDVFYATYGTTTSTEIEAAYQAGKAVYCIQELLPGEYYCFSLWYKYGSAFHQFVAAEGDVVHFAICDSDSWSELYTSCYSKPSSGIPKSDLASAVQTSLGKADTALQSYTETDPTVPSWAKASNKPNYTASEVGAVAANQGVAHAGEFVVVGSDGNITTVTMSVWQGGSY